MPEQKNLKVILLRHTLQPEETVALAAKLCYSKSTISDLNDKISSKDQSDFIKKLMDLLHLRRRRSQPGPACPADSSQDRQFFRSEPTLRFL